jgi:C-terminal processing protease CtpA/Prc
MFPKLAAWPLRVLTFIATIAIFTPLGWSQHISPLDREEAQAMLLAVTSDVRQSYYDPNLQGMDWDARVRKAKEKIANAPTVEVATSEIAAVLESLNDSHTFFVPPRYSVHMDYGWQFQMLGDRCYVTHVLPGSDAEAKGLRPGDEVMMIDGVMPTRENVRKMKYALDILTPRHGLRVGLFDPSLKKIRKVDVAAKVQETQNVKLDWDKNAAMNRTLDAEAQRHYSRVRYQEMAPDLMIVKFPIFIQTASEVEGFLDKARNHKVLIMDLRGSGAGIANLNNYVSRLLQSGVTFAGSVSRMTTLSLMDLRDSAEAIENDVLNYWVGGLFQRDVKIADRVSRGKTQPVVAMSNHRHVFPGKLIVLVDSDSASAAELFARVVQIEQRGIVLGDRTSGTTTQGQFFFHQSTFLFGAQVTQSELVMADGKSLEHLGVTPDETIVPSAQDLANGLDPVMTRAAEIAGVKLAPENALKLFPYEWARDRTYTH